MPLAAQAQEGFVVALGQEEVVAVLGTLLRSGQFSDSGGMCCCKPGIVGAPPGGGQNHTQGMIYHAMAW